MSSVDAWAMVNLTPPMTGLPMTVHAMPRGGARHDVRIKVHRTHGIRMRADNTAEVGIRPVPHLVENGLKPKDQVLVYQWATRNEAALVDYWEGRIQTDELLARLQRAAGKAIRVSGAIT